jgi:hypothetical protein
VIPMSYETPLDVMLGLYGKLLKTRDNQINKLAEIELQLKLLEYDSDDISFDLEEDLKKKKEEYQTKLKKTEKQLELLQKRRDGGASLDNFLDTGKAKVEE